ncbi:MAG TPA: UDP-N-acetylglucosamine 2-epimerase (non-hydrolyzing), partial [Acidobacteriota bacterium]|nr:UDP-N-acetylglucosamine 2-epimerase (non-hydrolyzing) [Acidobacteriota bacterium]
MFDIAPDFDLNVMERNQSLARVTSRIIEVFDELVGREHPDWILVQGDTTTVMATSLFGFCRRVRIGHVEAGLRSGDKNQPYPEEINRRISDLVADLHFAPTERNRENLLREGVSRTSVVVTGNTVIDALQMTVERLREIAQRVDLPEESEGKRLILVTAHRRESLGQPLQEICRGLKRIAEEFHDSVHIIYPVHPNPNVRDVVFAELEGSTNITLLDPVDYETLVQLMVSSFTVITDSGGIQEEAPSLNKPVLILRDVTERPEILSLRGAKLIGTSSDTIFGETCRLLENPSAYET